MPKPTDISFEQGYRRLEEIAELVNEDKVPVDRMCELFAEGKGLDQALSAYLAEQKGRIERIESGEEIQAFRIVPAGDDSAGRTAAAEDGSGHFAPIEPGAEQDDFLQGPADDEIPF